jgi:hypothetical protein
MSKRNGQQLNEEWEVNAAHALLDVNGKWYHHLERFPGALFDLNGYILFNTEDDYKNCDSLVLGDEVHVNGDGISSIPGYVRMTPTVRLAVTE